MGNRLILFCVLLSSAPLQADYFISINGQTVTEATLHVGQTAVISFGSTDTTPPGPDYYWGAGSMQVNDGFTGKCEWSAASVLPAAGPGAYIYHFDPPYEGALQLNASAPIEAGQWFTATYLATAEGDITLRLGWYDPDIIWITVAELLIHQLPPNPVAGELLAAWEGDYAGTIEDDRIMFVYDQSENGLHMYNGMSRSPGERNDYRPRRIADALNGHAVIQFDGEQYLECPNGTDPPDTRWNLAGQVTWFVVLNQFYPSPWPTDHREYILSVCYDDIDPDQPGNQSDPCGTWGVRSFLDSAGDERLASISVMAARPGNTQSGNDYAEETVAMWNNPGTVQSGWHVVTGVWDNNINPVTLDGQIDGRSNYIKGTPASSGDAGTTLEVSGFIGAFLGARSTEAVSQGVGDFFQGQIAEVRIYNGALEADRIQQEIRDLRCKYGWEICCADEMLLALLGSQWLSDTPCGADWTQDQHVDLYDLATVAAAWSPPCPRPATYYVAQSDGSDAYDGLHATHIGGNHGPFRTISRAAAVMRFGDTCYVRNGTYRETVTPAEGGTTYRNYPGEAPVVSGCDVFTPRSGQQWNTYSGHIYICPTNQNFEQLFVNGSMMNEARWPNCGLDQMIWAPTATAESGTDKYQLVDSDLPAPLHGGTWAGARIWINSGWQWTPFAKTISTYVAGQKLTFEDPTWTWPEWESWFLPRQGNPYYIFGSRAGLDQPGEWVLETVADHYVCYLWTPADDSPTEHLVEIKKRDHGFLVNNKSCVVIDGLRFFACGVEITGTSSAGNTVTHCRFRYLNHLRDANDRGLAYLFGEGSNRIEGTGNVFKNNRVYMAAGHGCYNKGHNTLLANNRFYGMGYFVGAGALQHDETASGGVTTRNTIQSCGRCGIDGYLKRMAITHNLIYDTMQNCHDGGCIYTYYNPGNGTVIAYNMCYNAANTGVGIYLDWYSSGMIVHHNKIWNCSDSAIRMNSPSENNSIYNNTCADGTRSLGFAVVTNPEGIAIDSMLGTVIQNNIFNGAVQISNVNPPVYTHNVYSDAFTDWLFPSVGSPAYNGGVAIPGYTCQGDSHPDCGAFDHSQCDYWTWGSTLDASWW